MVNSAHPDQIDQGLRQFLRFVKNDVRTLNFGRDDVHAQPRKHRLTFEEGCYAT